MDNKKLVPIIVVLVLAAGGAVFWYWSQRRAEAPEEKGAVETAKTISEAVPEIETNPGEKVPEINPLDRANPFRYTNPLK